MSVAPERMLGSTGVMLPPLGFGAFKIGRNQGTKYAAPYELPALADVQQLVDGIMGLGCRYFDTAPAYGVSEARLGLCLPVESLTISTKVGETFIDGQSRYDYSRIAVEQSLRNSCERLQRDVLDIVLIHSNGADEEILTRTEVSAVLKEWRDRGRIRAIGLSGKTPQGALLAMDWCDVLMVEYHLDDTSHADVLATALERQVGIIVKKGLASGRLPATDAIRFVLSHPAVTSLVIGGLSLAHFSTNWQTAQTERARRT